MNIRIKWREERMVKERKVVRGNKMRVNDVRFVVE